jgi:D-sedoheptulose 7-phosphate isomerase
VNELDRIYESSETPASFAAEYLSYLSKVLSEIKTTDIERFVTVLLNARETGNQIIFMGNGGSAATASHFANDISIGTHTLDKPFRAISITDNVAILTAVANDSGYDEIFHQQLKVVMRPGDIVVGISASGNSKNILIAIEYANSMGNETVGITAFDGGKLRDLAMQSIHVPTNEKEYGPAEDAHMVLDHLIGAYLMRTIKDDNK